MNSRTARLVFALLSLCLYLPPQMAAQTADPAPAPAPPRPKLIVLIIVDQMRTDYIEMYGSQWTKGLRRIVDQGAWFQKAAYPFFHTVTCTGHATISTGTFPATHGMILNGWRQRDESADVNCTDDLRMKLLSFGKDVEGRGQSIWRLQALTLADAIREQYGQNARIVSLSVKARSAIMLGGRQPDAAVWFQGGSFVTSTAYGEQKPKFLQSFFNRNRVESDLGRTWTRASRRSYLFEDDAPGEKPPGGWKRDFPHSVGSASGKPDSTFYGLWQVSPYADQYLGEMAVFSVDALKMGQGPAVDLLAVSFSALDSVGHSFGPQSHEVQDVMVRLDDTIGKLLAHLDKKVGPENYIVAFSSDHGVAPVPERKKKEDNEGGRILSALVAQRVEGALYEALGPGPHIERMIYTDLYFRPATLAKLKEKPEGWQAVIKGAQSVEGVLRVLTSEELEKGRNSDDPLVRSASLSHYPGRSGDVIVLPRPYWIFVNPSRDNPPGPGSTHGTGHDYDTHVPVILLGPGFRAGKYDQDATPADIAPTLAQIAGVKMNGVEGRVLREAFGGAAGVPAASASSPPKP